MLAAVSGVKAPATTDCVASITRSQKPDQKRTLLECVQVQLEGRHRQFEVVFDQHFGMNLADDTD